MSFAYVFAKTNASISTSPPSSSSSIAHGSGGSITTFPKASFTSLPFSRFGFGFDILTVHALSIPARRTGTRSGLSAFTSSIIGISGGSAGLNVESDVSTFSYAPRGWPVR